MNNFNNNSIYKLEIFLNGNEILAIGEVLATRLVELELMVKEEPDNAVKTALRDQMHGLWGKFLVGNYTLTKIDHSPLTPQAENGTSPILSINR